MTENVPPRPGVAEETMARVKTSAGHLAEHMHEAPVWIIPCLVAENGRPSGEGTIADLARKSLYSSIYPAVQNILLACRGLGLGACLTTIHLMHEAGRRQAPRAARQRRDHGADPDRLAGGEVRPGEACAGRRGGEPRSLRAAVLAVVRRARAEERGRPQGQPGARAAAVHLAEEARHARQHVTVEVDDREPATARSTCRSNGSGGSRRRSPSAAGSSGPASARRQGRRCGRARGRGAVRRAAGHAATSPSAAADVGDRAQGPGAHDAVEARDRRMAGARR